MNSYSKKETEEKLKFFKDSDVFRGIDQNLLMNLCYISDLKRYTYNEVVVVQGQYMSHIVLIKEGYFLIKLKKKFALQSVDLKVITLNKLVVLAANDYYGGIEVKYHSNLYYYSLICGNKYGDVIKINRNQFFDLFRYSGEQIFSKLSDKTKVIEDLVKTKEMKLDGIHKKADSLLELINFASKYIVTNNFPGERDYRSKFSSTLTSGIGNYYKTEETDINSNFKKKLKIKYDAIKHLRILPTVVHTKLTYSINQEPDPLKLHSNKPIKVKIRIKNSEKIPFTGIEKEQIPRYEPPQGKKFIENENFHKLASQITINVKNSNAIGKDYLIETEKLNKAFFIT